MTNYYEITPKQERIEQYNLFKKKGLSDIEIIKKCQADIQATLRAEKSSIDYKNQREYGLERRRLLRAVIKQIKMELPKKGIK